MNPGWWIIAKDETMAAPETGRVLCAHPAEGRLAVNIERDGGWCRKHNVTDPHNSYWVSPHSVIFAAETKREIDAFIAKHDTGSYRAYQNHVAAFQKDIKKTFRDMRPLVVAFDTPASIIEPHTRGVVFWKTWNPSGTNNTLMRNCETINGKSVFLSVFRPLVLIVPFIPNDEDIGTIKAVISGLAEPDGGDSITRELEALQTRTKREEIENATRTIEYLEMQVATNKRILTALQDTPSMPDDAIAVAIRAKYEYVEVQDDVVYALTKPLKIKYGKRHENIGRWRITMRGDHIDVLWAGAIGRSAYHPHVSGTRVCNGNTELQEHLGHKRYAEALIVLLDILENYSSGNPYVSLPSARNARKTAEQNIQIMKI